MKSSTACCLFWLHKSWSQDCVLRRFSATRTLYVYMIFLLRTPLHLRQTSLSPTIFSFDLPAIKAAKGDGVKDDNWKRRRWGKIMLLSFRNWYRISERSQRLYFQGFRFVAWQTGGFYLFLSETLEFSKWMCTGRVLLTHIKSECLDGWLVLPT